MSPVSFNATEGTFRLREGIEMKVGLRPEVYFGLGIYYLKLSEQNANYFLNAIRYFETALTINPYFEEALLNLGAIYYNNKDFNKAYNFFEKLSNIS